VKSLGRTADSGPQRRAAAPNARQRTLAFVFGVSFIVVMLLLAVFFSHPTPWQYLVFRVVLALAAAGIAVMIPGFIQVQVAGSLRAGGALGVFAVVCYVNPASLVVPVPPSVGATASADCAEENQGSCTILVSVENHGLGSVEVQALQYKVVTFRDLGGTLGAPAYVPEKIGDLDLAPRSAAGGADVWLSSRTGKVESLARGESTSVTYRATAKQLGARFGLWTLQARLKTSSTDVDLGTLELMLPHWETKLMEGQGS
jgi:hypothetical protein